MLEIPPQAYYVNTITKETRWIKPEEAPKAGGKEQLADGEKKDLWSKKYKNDFTKWKSAPGSRARDSS